MRPLRVASASQRGQTSTPHGASRTTIRWMLPRTRRSRRGRVSPPTTRRSANPAVACSTIVRPGPWRPAWAQTVSKARGRACTRVSREARILVSSSPPGGEGGAVGSASPGGQGGESRCRDVDDRQDPDDGSGGQREHTGELTGPVRGLIAVDGDQGLAHGAPAFLVLRSRRAFANPRGFRWCSFPAEPSGRPQQQHVPPDVPAAEPLQ